MARLDRLLRPRSVAVIGGGAWCSAVVEQTKRMGFGGAIWPVHPRAKTVAGYEAFPSIDDLPGTPDAVFIGCLLYTSPSPRDRQKSRMPSSA